MGWVQHDSFIYWNKNKINENNLSRNEFGDKTKDILIILFVTGTPFSFILIKITLYSVHTYYSE